MHDPAVFTCSAHNLGLLMRKKTGFGTPKGYFYLNSVQIYILTWGRMAITMILFEIWSETGEKFIGAQMSCDQW